MGGPKWDNPNAADRPERGLLAIRKELRLFANVRPVKLHRQLIGASTLKEEVLQGVDLVVIRELTGGIYFGPRQEAGAEAAEAYDTMLYTRPEIERGAPGRRTAMGRRKSSPLWTRPMCWLPAGWRRVATDVLASTGLRRSMCWWTPCPCT